MDLFGWRKKQELRRQEALRLEQELEQARRDLAARNASHSKAMIDLGETIIGYNRTGEFTAIRVRKTQAAEKMGAPFPLRHMEGA
jgi:hypothetical protein